MTQRHSSPKLSIITLLVSQALISTSAFAAGFQLNEVSPGLFGNAIAGSGATKNDVSSMFINPANLANMTDNQAYIGAHFIYPQIKMSDATAVHSVNVPGLPPTVISANVIGDNDQNNVARSAVIPDGYVSYRINDQLVAGLALVSPFGLTTNYNEDSVLRFAAQNSAVRTVNFVPTIAYSINKQFGIGLGLQAQYMKANFSNFNGPYTGTVADELIAADQPTRLHGQDWGFGFTLGGIYNYDDCTRFGIGYRSQVVERLRGTGQQYSSPGPTVPAPAIEFPFNGETSVKANVTTPAVLNISAAQDIYDWTVKATLQYNFWSSINKLTIYMPEAYATSFTLQTKWRDTWFAALGADYRLNEQWIFRGGIAYDETPTKDTYRDPRIPDSDRYWLNLGATFQINQAFSIDAAYSHIFGVDQTVDVVLASGSNSTTTLPLEVNQVYAKYKNSVDIFALALRYSF